jgi:hypothetical protein
MSHQTRDGRNEFSRFMKGNHFEAAHISIVDTWMEETTGFAEMVTSAFQTSRKLTGSSSTRSMFLKMLKENCGTASTMKGVLGRPIGLMALSMLVTDFCYSKASLLKMKTLFVRGARPGSGRMPIQWNGKNINYHEETTGKRASQRKVSWISYLVLGRSPGFPTHTYVCVIN